MSFSNTNAIGPRDGHSVRQCGVWPTAASCAAPNHLAAKSPDRLATMCMRGGCPRQGDTVRRSSAVPGTAIDFSTTEAQPLREGPPEEPAPPANETSPCSVCGGDALTRHAHSATTIAPCSAYVLATLGGRILPCNTRREHYSTSIPGCCGRSIRMDISSSGPHSSTRPGGRLTSRIEVVIPAQPRNPQILCQQC